jgi:hypothetical protein
MHTRRPASVAGWLLLSGFLATLVVGCGGPDYKRRAVVRGKVTLDGKPVTVGTVMFYGPNNMTSTASIDEDGYYTMADAPLGEVRITVTVPKLPPGGVTHLKGAPPPPHPPGSPPPPDPASVLAKVVSIPVRYSNPETSPLTYTVEPREQEFDIKLTK